VEYAALATVDHRAPLAVLAVMAVLALMVILANLAIADPLLQAGQFLLAVVHKSALAYPVRQATTARQAPKDSQDLQATLEPQESTENQAARRRRVQLDPLGLQGIQEAQVHRADLGKFWVQREATQVLRELQESQDHLAPLEVQVALAKMEAQEGQVHQETQEPQAPLENRGHQDHQATLANQVPKAVANSAHQHVWHLDTKCSSRCGYSESTYISIPRIFSDKHVHFLLLYISFDPLRSVCARIWWT
jgi:hypothetical protein